MEKELDQNTADKSQGAKGGRLHPLVALAELSRPVFYRGENACGQHLFSDCSPMVTHVFATIDEAMTAFPGRDIRNLPNASTVPTKGGEEKL